MGCACCLRCAMGDPLALLEQRRGMGDLLPRVVWPTDVDREKARLDPLFLATDLAVQRCGGLSTAERSGWAAFMAEWRAFRSRETPTFGAPNEWDLAQQYAKDLAGWQATMATKCTLAGPLVRPTDDPTDKLDLSPLKWIAAAAIVVAGAYAIKTVL